MKYTRTVLTVASATVLVLRASGAQGGIMPRPAPAAARPPVIVSGIVPCDHPGTVVLAVTGARPGMTVEGWFDGGWRPTPYTANAGGRLDVAGPYGRWRAIAPTGDGGGLVSRQFDIPGDRCVTS